jgi:SAM-dependent methyltransferase
MPKHAQLYCEDLAQIHIDGYGFHWERAAPSLLQWLQDHGIESGLVVDLGCGGGQWLAHLADRGYKTCGVDASPHMIRAAKRIAPRSSFICGSFADVKIPNCDAVTSLGEPLNYLNSGALMRRTIRNVFASLRSGGVFVFDVRHPPARQLDTVHHNKIDQDWFCHARIEEDANQLTRYITTFRRVGGDRFRRSEEIHRLKLFSQAQVLDWLRDTGFRVRTRRSYGDYRLTDRQSVFICRKPR